MGFGPAIKRREPVFRSVILSHVYASEDGYNLYHHLAIL